MGVLVVAVVLVVIVVAVVEIVVVVPVVFAWSHCQMCWFVLVVGACSDSLFCKHRRLFRTVAYVSRMVAGPAASRPV